jgi:hypothetical protein
LVRGLAVPLKNMKYDDDLFPIVADKYLPKEALAQKKFHPYTGSVGFFRHEDVGSSLDFRSFSALFSGRYRVRISLWSFQWDKGRVMPAGGDEVVQLAVRGPEANRSESLRTIGYFDAPSLRPTVYEREVWLNRGESLKVNFASQWPRAAIDGWLTKYVGPAVAIDWLDVEGPLHAQWPPPSHRRLFGRLPLVPLPDSRTEPHPLPRTPPLQVFDISRNQPGKYAFATAVPTARPSTDAALLLGDFLPRAFRRPVSAAEVARYVGLVKKQLDADRYFEEAMRAACKAALCSPDFLFLREMPGQLDDWALASRLSYFLWNSMPDDALGALAEQGRLHQRHHLREQVERMLRDPRSDRFVRDFLAQWLDLRDINATCPDPRLYPEFSPYLGESMVEESRAFFRELLDKDLPASNLVHSDFLVLNQRLAEHYGIAGVRGAAFRRVPLPPGSHRGGILTQASVLKVTANGTVTSPVKRGVWVQRKLVGRPPEPPPPNLPVIEPDVRGAVTIREQLAKHRSQAVCASCHAAMDPPGFALESFDVIGGWRDRYRFLPSGSPQHLRYQVGLPVDPGGETAGRPFRNVDEFKQILLEDPRQIARNLVRHLIVYATGAPPTFADRPLVEQILDRADAPNYRLRSLLHEIVQSPLFQRK